MTKRMLNRSLSLLLALVMCAGLLPVHAHAAISCELLDKKISFTWTYYITYRWHGKDWNSLETGSETNYDAWNHMSREDKMAVLRHFSGYSSQLASQFAHSDEMLAFALSESGWRQLKDAHNTRMQQTNFGTLYEFYVTQGKKAYTLSDSVRMQLDAEETKTYEKLLNEYDALWNSGKESYDKLVSLKNTQITNAVNAISSELIKIIMDNCTSGKPSGETLDDLLDATFDMLDENLEISDSIKKYTGIGTPAQYAQEFADKFTGEDDRIDIGDAVELINLINRLMAAQEKHATVCMEKCQDRARRLSNLGASYTTTAAKRAAQKEADRAAWQQAWSAAADLQINLTDLEPGVGSVHSEDYDKNSDNKLEGDELTEFHAAQLAAARDWASSEWSWAVGGLRDLWDKNWKGETISSGSARYFDHDRWYAFQANDYYSDAFARYNEIMADVSLGPVNGPGSVETACEWAQAHFKATRNYREALDAYALGYQNSLDKLNTLKGDLLAAKQSYIDAWETERDLYIQNAAPYRTRAYNLTHQASYVEPYGEWNWVAGSGTTLDGMWGSFEEEYEGHVPYFAQNASVFDNALDQIELEIISKTAAYETYKQGMEAFDNWLPQYFKFNAEVQWELVNGLAIVNKCLGELETLRASYPDWVTQFNVTANINSVVGGIIIPNNIRNMIADDYGLSHDTLAESEYATLETKVAPRVGAWLQREKELLNEIYRADRLLGEASHKRPQDVAYNGWSAAELDNLNSLPGVSHGVVIEPMLKLISHADPYYHYSNSLNYFDESGVVTALPKMPGYTVQLSTLYDDMMGNGAPMRAMRARYAQFLEERGKLLRLAYGRELNKANAYYASKGVGSDYFSTAYPSNWYPSNTKRLEYWANRGSFRLWDLYNFLNGYNGNDNFAQQIREISYINSGSASYNPVNHLNKGGQVSAAVLSPWGGSALAMRLHADAPVDATLDVGDTTRFLVTAVGENDAFEPTYPDVNWSSSDESIVSVDVNGKLTALLPGTVTITATAEDSPSDAPIKADFVVQVKSGSCTDLSQLGGGIYVLSPKAERSGSLVTVTGLLGTNDEDDFVNGTVFAAVYDGSGRYLGCSTGEFLIQVKQTSALSIRVSTSGTPATVKLFLLNKGGFVPVSGYEPVELNVA